MPADRAWRRWLLRALFESALIVLSILLALAVNEWRDGRQMDQRVREARSAFAAEVGANRGALASEQGGLPYHRRLWQRYKGLGEIQQPTADDLRPLYAEFPSGVNMVRLHDAVWRSLAGSDVTRRLDQRELFLLAEVYRQQQEIDDYNRAMYAAWRQVNAEAGTPAFVKDDIRNTRAYLADVIAAEERLAALYDRALARLEPSARAR